MHTFLRRIYGIYAMAMFALVVLILFCPFLIVAPTLAIRREIGRLCVSAWMFVSFIRFRRRGFGNLPTGPCVLVCNHASYLDGIILTAALPRRFTFLVQHGAADWPYAGLIIKRMGVMFVNRGSTRAAALVTREIIKRLQQGESIVIFAEGTFRRKAELRPFQSGAFLIAARAQVPIVPCILSGTRVLFGEGQKLPRHSKVRVECFSPIMAKGTDRDAAKQLLRAVRTVMLEHCGEADGELTSVVEEGLVTGE